MNKNKKEFIIEYQIDSSNQKRIYPKFEYFIKMKCPKCKAENKLDNGYFMFYCFPQMKQTIVFFCGECGDHVEEIAELKQLDGNGFATYTTTTKEPFQVYLMTPKLHFKKD
tara:strand:+ start:350 stop:682 length:333 start_codon:yes stop_codon:yes gene_type:complete